MYKLIKFQKHPEEYTKMCNESESNEHRRQNQTQMEKANRMNIYDMTLKFFIKGRLPLSKLNSKHFNDLIDGNTLLVMLIIYLFIEN